VFLRAKKPPIEGLQGDENVLGSWKYKMKTAFMKYEKNIGVITNKRILFAHQKDKKIFAERNLSEITAYVVNQSIETDIHASQGSTSRVVGSVKITHEGEEILYIDSIYNPQDLVNEIQACKIANSTNGQPAHSTLPKGFGISNENVTIEDNEDEEKHQADTEDPVKILKIRYAKGEISKEEFEEMKSMLG